MVVKVQSGGGSARAKTFTASVPLTTGLLTTVSSFGLLAPVTFAKTGGNANLTLASNGQISAAAALTAGATQSLTGTATGSDGVVFPFTANLTGAVSKPAAPSVTLTAGNGQISIAWVDGSNGGAAITAHTIYVNGAAMLPISSASPYVLTGLANGVAVNIEVSAINSAGEGAKSAVQSATPTALPAPTSTFTMSQIPTADTKRIYQRSTTTGGGQGKGQGTIPITISSATAGTINARCRAADGATVLQSEWQAATVGAGATTANITGVDARLGWFYLDLKGADGSWQNGTTLVGMGALFGLAGQSLMTRILGRQENTATYASLGITPDPNSSALVTYNEIQSYMPTISTMAWQQPGDWAAGTGPNGLGVGPLLNSMISMLGVNCGAVGHAQGAQRISTFVPGGSNSTQLLSLISRAGGAFEGFFWGQGHADAQYGLPPKAYQAMLSRLFASLTSANSFSGYGKYLWTIPSCNGSAEGQPDNINKIRQGAIDWCAANSATYVHMYDFPLLNDYTHQTNPGAVTMAGHMYRATRSYYGQTSGVGPQVLSAARSGTTITVTLSDVGQSNLVLTGTPQDRIYVFPSGMRNKKTAIANNRFPVSSVTVTNKTTLTLTLANDPGDGHALDLFFYWPTDSIDPSVSNIRDNRTDGDGITVGRLVQANGTSIAVAAPVPAGAVNAPPSGFIARTSQFDMVGTGDTYAASAAGFGQMLTGGNTRTPAWSGSSTGSPEFVPITIEGFFVCPTLGGQQTIFSTGGDGIVVNAAGKITSLLAGVTGATTLVAGKRYHFAYQRGPSGTSIYLQNITDAGAGVRDGFSATAITASAASGRFTAHDYSDLSRPMTGGGVDEIAVWQIEKYSGTSYTAPTTPYLGTEADLVALFHLDGNGADAANNW